MGCGPRRERDDKPLGSKDREGLVLGIVSIFDSSTLLRLFLVVLDVSGDG